VTSTVDQFSLELERLSEHDSSENPVRAIATNRKVSSKTAEAWWGLAQTRANLLSLLHDEVIAESFFQQLEDHRYVELNSRVGSTKTDLVVFNPDELIRVGFDSADL